MSAEMIRAFMWLLVGAAASALLFVQLWRSRRGRLDCGCLNDGRAVYGCMTCCHTRCAEHRYVIHTCTEGREA